jgi:uridine phosphorylase
MNRDELMILAKKVSAAQQRVTTMGMMQTPIKLKDKIIADANYRIAMDALTAAKKEYDGAIANLTADELIAISTA